MLLLLLLPCADPSALTGHTGWVGAVAFKSDCKRLATASADRTVRTWSVDGTAIDTLKGHTDTACAVDFLPEGLVSGGHDGTVRLWRKGESKTLETRRGAVLSVAAAPDGKAVAAGGIDGVITLLDPSGGKEAARLTGHKSWVNALAFSDDGKRLASASSDGTVRLWDPVAKELISVFELPDPREVRGVALSPDGKYVAAAVRFGTVWVWDVASRKVLASEKAHDGEAWSVCFTPDGTLVSGGGDWGKPGTVKLWDATTWKVKATLTPPAEVLSVAASPDGRWLAAVGTGKTVWLWDRRKLEK
jgi:WD40 repeat protein